MNPNPESLLIADRNSKESYSKFTTFTQGSPEVLDLPYLMYDHNVTLVKLD